MSTKLPDGAGNLLLDDPEHCFWQSVGVCPVPGCDGMVTHSLFGDITNYMCSHCFYWWSEPISTGVCETFSR